jgi:hypothetical protein
MNKFSTMAFADFRALLESMAKPYPTKPGFKALVEAIPLQDLQEALGDKHFKAMFKKLLEHELKKEHEREFRKWLDLDTPLPKPEVAASNDGLLEEPLTEAQLKAAEEEKIRERNLRLEQKDRQAGATFVNSKGEVQKSHMSESEKEELLEKSKKESVEEYKKAIAWIKGAADRRNQPQELAPSATDVANQLNNILAPTTVSTATKETKQAITKWMRSTDSNLVLAARRNNPDWAAKMDKILLKTFEADL